MFHDPYRMIIASLIASLLLFISIFIYRYIYPKREINLFYLLILLSIIPILSILRSGTYEAGDLTLHSVFLQSFYESLEDGIVIPQWAGGLCGGYGCPIFMFEYVLPYYIGSIFHFLGLSFINSIKAVLIFSYIMSGVTMYVFAKELVGKLGGFVAGIFYLFAPYHLVDMHFRVGIGEVVSFVFIPLIFFFTIKIIKTGRGISVIMLSFFSALLILTHTSSAVTTFSLALLYSIVLWSFTKKKKYSSIIGIFSAYIVGFLLTVYYWLPALIELKYTWYGLNLNEVGLDFKPFLEHIYSPAGFGFLFQGNEGEQRLIIGYPHLSVIFISFFLLLKNRFKHNKALKAQLIYFLFAFIVCMLLLLSITKPLWLATPVLKSFVIAYRMLVPIMFITSIIAGIIILKFRSKTLIILLCLFTIYSTILNWGNRKMVEEDVNAYNTHWSLYTEYTENDNVFYQKIYSEKSDQIPNLVLERPQKPLEILNGDAKYNIVARTNVMRNYNVYARSNIILRENTFYFPGWEVFVNGNSVPVNFKNNDKLGVMTFEIPRGLHEIKIEFKDTPIRKYTKYISLSILLLLFIILIELNIKVFNRFKSKIFRLKI